MQGSLRPVPPYQRVINNKIKAAPAEREGPGSWVGMWVGSHQPPLWVLQAHITQAHTVLHHSVATGLALTGQALLSLTVQGLAAQCSQYTVEQVAR
ncbi:hypothetical protein E2C01_004237 [Portunus trituberculatus]|uniref:Uncharacterized protein n=1 Tax=Portunus trituberculatus TaxID=210409 RepID=A0A5B7CQ20_PORTR|nr:hypothetical protein [Portunus trituberculatus]